MAFGGTTTLQSDHLYFVQNTLGLTERIQIKTVFNGLRWPVGFFACREELLQNLNVSRTSVKDHSATLDSRVFHRDLSDGNMIMESMQRASENDVYDVVSRKTGKLIALDHAKRTEHMKTVENFIPSSDDVRLYTQISNNLEIQVAEDAMAQALKFHIFQAMRYCQDGIWFDVLKSKSDRKGDWTAKDLGWNDIGPQPDFDSRVPDDDPFYMDKTLKSHPQGTIPFISHRLIAGLPETQLSEAYNAIHDMESLFWVLIHVCLIKKSRGGRRRKDVSGERDPEKSKTPEESERERNILIAKLFYSDQKLVGLEKKIHFNNTPDDSFKLLLEHVHEYFEPLKDLLRRWRNVLVLGHTFQAYEYHRVHHYILDILNDTLALSGSTD